MAEQRNEQGRRISRDGGDDYTREAAGARREFAEGVSGATLEHVSSYSFDPSVLPGNVESFLGVAHVRPIISASTVVAQLRPGDD